VWLLPANAHGRAVGVISGYCPQMRAISRLLNWWWHTASLRDSMITGTDMRHTGENSCAMSARTDTGVNKA